jgi:transposase
LKKTYTPELKEEAVKLVLAQGLSIEQVAARVSIPKGTLANWRCRIDDVAGPVR